MLGVARGCSRMRWQLLRREVELLVEGASGQVAGAAGRGASVVPAGDLDGRVLLEMLADAVIAADATNRIVYANPAAGALLGWDPGKLVGQPLTTIVPERLRAAHLAGFTRYLDTRQARLIGRSARVAASRADGTEVEVELTLNTFRPASSADLFIASLRDLSDRVEAERLGALTRYLAATTEVAVQLGITGEVASLADAAPMVLAAIGTHLGWDAGSIWELDPDGEQLRCLEVWQAPGVETGEFLAATRGRRFSKDVGLPGRVWSGAETVWITDVARDLNFPRAPQAIRAGVRSAFGFPVLSGGECWRCRVLLPGDQAADEDLVGDDGGGRQIGQFIARSGPRLPHGHSCGFWLRRAWSWMPRWSTRRHSPRLPACVFRDWVIPVWSTWLRPMDCVGWQSPASIRPKRRPWPSCAVAIHPIPLGRTRPSGSCEPAWPNCSNTCRTRCGRTSPKTSSITNCCGRLGSVLASPFRWWPVGGRWARSRWAPPNPAGSSARTNLRCWKRSAAEPGWRSTTHDYTPNEPPSPPSSRRASSPAASQSLWSRARRPLSRGWGS